MILNFSRLWLSVWNMLSSKLKGSFVGGGSGVFLVGFGVLCFFCLSVNCSGGSIIRSL